MARTYDSWNYYCTSLQKNKQRELNTVFQKYALFPNLNVYENIAFGLRLKKVPDEEIKEKTMKEMRDKVKVVQINRDGNIRAVTEIT